MQNRLLFLLCFAIGWTAQSQTVSKDFRMKTLFIEKDSVQLDSVAINPDK